MIAATTLLGLLELDYLFGPWLQLDVVVHFLFGLSQYAACKSNNLNTPWGFLYFNYCFISLLCYIVCVLFLNFCWVLMF